MPKAYNRAIMTITDGSNVGAIVLGAEDPNGQTFLQAGMVGGESGLKVAFDLENKILGNADNWAICNCTFTAPNLLAVDSVEDSSNAGAMIALTANHVASVIDTASEINKSYGINDEFSIDPVNGGIVAAGLTGDGKGAGTMRLRGVYDNEKRLR